MEAVKRISPNHQLKTLLTSTLSTSLPLHISLSAPLSIAGERKDAFLETLDRKLPSLSPFSVTLSDLEWVSNNEGTRWFLVLKCDQPGRDELNELLRSCNRLCKDFGLGQLYVNAPSDTLDEVSVVKMSERKLARARRKSRQEQKERESLKEELSWIQDFGDHFHFSIAWCLNEPPNGAGDEERAIADLMQDVGNMKVDLDSVKVKIGNVVTSLEVDGGQRREKSGILC